jgi:uncharacterized protein (DUF305 family)
LQANNVFLWNGSVTDETAQLRELQQSMVRVQSEEITQMLQWYRQWYQQG